MSLKLTIELPADVVAAIRAAATAQEAKDDAAIADACTNQVVEAVRRSSTITANESARQIPFDLDARLAELHARGEAMERAIQGLRGGDELLAERVQRLRLSGSQKSSRAATVEDSETDDGTSTIFTPPPTEGGTSVADPLDFQSTMGDTGSDAEGDHSSYTVLVKKRATASSVLRQSYSFRLPWSANVRDIKEKLSASSGVPVSDLRLFGVHQMLREENNRMPVVLLAEPGKFIASLEVDTLPRRQIPPPLYGDSASLGRPHRIPSSQHFSIFVKAGNKPTITLLINNNTTLRDLKYDISDLAKVPVCSSRVQFLSQILEDNERTLSSYGVTSESTLTAHVAICEYRGVPEVFCREHDRSLVRDHLREQRDN